VIVFRHARTPFAEACFKGFAAFGEVFLFDQFLFELTLWRRVCHSAQSSTGSCRQAPNHQAQGLAEQLAEGVDVLQIRRQQHEANVCFRSHHAEAKQLGVLVSRMDWMVRFKVLPASS